MSGLVKAKEHKLEDSNVENIGSELDRDVKKKAAKTEEAWKGAGQKVGIEVWRIVDFQVEKWPKEDYGEFYRGDSYIILRTYKEKDSEELQYDLHFWLGKESTQDEMGTAAYKTVELDTLLDDKPVQYREVEKHESKMFKACFDSITYLEGGAPSGFKYVTKEIPPSRVYELTGDRQDNICINEISKPSWKSFCNKNVFVIIVGKSILRYFGSECNKHEKWSATDYVGNIKDRVYKYNSTNIILDDDDITKMIELYRKKNPQENEAAACQQQQEEEQEEQEQEQEQELSKEDQEKLDLFETLRSFLGDPPEDFDIKTNVPCGKEKDHSREEDCEEDFTTKLIRVGRTHGHKSKTAKPEMEVVAEGDDISEDMIDEEHVNIFDNGAEVYTFAGKKVDKKDKNSQMVYCCNYLSDKANKNAPVLMVKTIDKFKEEVKACKKSHR